MCFGLLQPDESYLAHPDITNSFRQHQSIQASLIHLDIRDNTQQLQDETGKQVKLSKYPQLCLSKLFPQICDILSLPFVRENFNFCIFLVIFLFLLINTVRILLISFLKEPKNFFLFDLCFLCHYYVLVFVICFLLLILKFCTF